MVGRRIRDDELVEIAGGLEGPIIELDGSFEEGEPDRDEHSGSDAAGHEEAGGARQLRN